MLTVKDNIAHRVELNLRFGELGPFLSWCNSNCTGHWGYEVLDEAGREPGNYKFYFSTESDYINFVLWKT